MCHLIIIESYLYYLGEDKTTESMRRNSLFSTTFSKDVIKIRADVLKSIPLTTSSETSTTKPPFTTSASISSTDSGKSKTMLTIICACLKILV